MRLRPVLLGGTAIVSVSNGSLAGAATNLLDATLVEGMGEPAGAATDLLDALNSECTEELPGAPTTVPGDNGGCAAAESDLHGTLNSRGVLSSIGVGCAVHAEDHGSAASVQGDTGSATFSLPLDSSIRGSDSNSSHHPIHACAHSRLDSCGVGSGVGFGIGAGAVVSCVVSSGAVDDVDDPCTDGSVSDLIHTGSNSVIQGFSEYHDSSCVRLNALQNSRMERGHHVRGGIKRPSTGSLSAGHKRALSQQQPVKVA